MEDKGEEDSHGRNYAVATLRQYQIPADLADIASPIVIKLHKNEKVPHILADCEKLKGCYWKVQIADRKDIPAIIERHPAENESLDGLKIKKIGLT